MVATALADYLATQYLTYANLLEQHRLPADRYPFSQYIRDVCEKMSFSRSGSSSPGSELGIFGYFFKLLEMAGYVLGATLPALIVSAMPYCRACQKYLTKHRTAFVSSPALWSQVKKLSKKEREAALAEAITPLLERAGQLSQDLASAPLSGTEAVLAGLDANAAPGTAAHLAIVLEKCPTCEAHVVRVNLQTYTADKEVAQNAIATFDKIEPAAAGPST